MSQKFRIKNDKGLFVEVSTWGLMTPSTLAGLRSEILPLMAERERGMCEKALDLMGKLPLVRSSMDITRFDPQYDPVEDAHYREARSRSSWGRCPSAVVEAHGWLQPAAAKAASKGEGIECPSSQAAGWLDIGAVAQAASWINLMLRKASADPISEFRYKGANTAAKRAKELVFEPIDAFCELASTEAWMLFVRNGFLDDKGNVGPLARARMFESPKAASKTANARGLSQWKVVKGSVELKGLEDFPGDSVPDKLAQAIAMREGDLIRQALQSASMDALKSRLAELEAKLGEGDPDQAPAPARPRSRL